MVWLGEVCDGNSLPKGFIMSILIGNLFCISNVSRGLQTIKKPAGAGQET